MNEDLFFFVSNRIESMVAAHTNTYIGTRLVHLIKKENLEKLKYIIEWVTYSKPINCAGMLDIHILK